MNDLIIIGAGPAGMLAAYAAASRGIDTLLLEKNEKIGKSCLLQERDAAISPIPVMRRLFFNLLSVTLSFFTALFTAIQTGMSSLFLKVWDWL